ncbi:Hsp20/alpha crystallin family protein [Deinococcus wulumuqiensis]
MSQSNNEAGKPVLARLQHLMTLREEVEALAHDGPWTPAADWRDAGTHLELLLDVPGVDPASLALEEDGGQLTVSGERQDAAGEGRPLLSRERPSGRFSRLLSFPEPVRPESGDATLAGGVLTVRFEKLHPTIDVTAHPAPGNG